MPPDPPRRYNKGNGAKKSWWRSHFHDHPGHASRSQDSELSGQKTKVYCIECMNANIAEIQKQDEAEVGRNERGSVRTVDSIVAYLWTLNMQQEKDRGYLNSRSTTLLVHLKHCSHQPSDVRARASKESDARNQKARHQYPDSDNLTDPDQTVFTAAHLDPTSIQATPQGFYQPVPLYGGGEHLQTPGGAGGSGLQHTPPGTAPSLTPLSVNLANPGRWMYSPQASPSPASASREPSPWSQPASSSASPAPTGLVQLPSQDHPFAPSGHAQAGLRRSSSNLRNERSASRFRPYPSPYSTAPPWSAERQQRFESLVARLTASANLPLSWVQNPAWLSICDEFISPAKPPSRRVLTSRLLRDEVKFLRGQAITRTEGAEATVQGDGWTGINNHHLVAFMMTAKREVHTIRVIDTSDECKTATNFLKHIEDTVETLGNVWKVVVVVFTSDAAGESRAARLALLAKYPHLIVLDCYAHQINLIVGDYLKSKSSLLKFTDNAEELITWLQMRTFALARLRAVQAQHSTTAPVTVIRAVKTRWTSHYLAIKRLLELHSALKTILAEDELRSGVSTFMAGLKKKESKIKARHMIALMQDGTFWHSLNRIKLHLEPLAIAANVAQASNARLDQVLLIFGFLYHRFSSLPLDVHDEVAASTVLKSIELRWSKADQVVFIAAVILNPMYKLQPFADLPEFSEIELETLLCRLWTRFFQSNAPVDLKKDIQDYFRRQGRFQHLDKYVEQRIEIARSERTAVDPLDIWKGSSSPDKPMRPLATLAHRLLSVCANSASCERLFSVFGQLLTRLRNRMSATTLTTLAELKMHLRDEYVRTHDVKERLKRHCGKPAAEASSVPSPAPAAPAATTSESNPIATTLNSPTLSAASEDEDLEDLLAYSFESTAGTSPTGDLHAIAAALAEADRDDTDPIDLRPSSAYRVANGLEQPFKKAIALLFNFNSTHWMQHIAGFASLGLDEELELHELLDYDAAGEVVDEGNENADGFDGDLGLDDMTLDVMQS